MKSTLYVLSILLILLNACSQVVPPIGGKKDTLAPVLLKSTPVNKQKNFTGQTIELFFNEEIKLDNPNQKILITPQPEETFKAKARPTSLRLTFSKPFQENTTYTFNFTDAVKDVNESNPAVNLKIVFSTGNLIDSLRVGGKVTDLQTGQPVLNTLVGLYTPSDTLTPVKIKPYYFTRTDTAGNFAIENIRSGTYKVYAFDDKNLNLLLNAGVERVAFVQDTITVNQNIDTLKLALFTYYNTPPRVVRTEQRSSTYTLIFDRGLKTVSTRFENVKDSIPSFLRTPSELTFFNTQTSTDTIRVQIAAADSLNNTVDLKQNIRFRQATRREASTPLEITSRPANNEDVDRDMNISLRFSKPVLAINQDSLRLFSDSANRETLTEENFRWLPDRTELTITKRISARREVRLLLGKGAFMSVLDDSSAAVRYIHPLRNVENYGTLGGKIITKATSFIIELLDENYKVIDQQFNKINYRFTNVKPGKYRLRVIIDTNENGKWDSGSLPENKLPEAIFHHPLIVPVKLNFDVEGIDINAQ
ncbi:Ig-like domain-containing domain [Tellurirhabdus bombi]|uniref:Ig-like domain-containing domain n=1 Tax=Tellurirhabdus bombi TaxID=2907205 RepID=UPI001F3731D7|nr:Ig-like domain-containing domain [Tellurirhabdus bombi]